MKEAPERPKKLVFLSSDMSGNKAWSTHHQRESILLVSHLKSPPFSQAVKCCEKWEISLFHFSRGAIAKPHGEAVNAKKPVVQHSDMINKYAFFFNSADLTRHWTTKRIEHSIVCHRRLLDCILSTSSLLAASTRQDKRGSPEMPEQDTSQNHPLCLLLHSAEILLCQTWALLEGINYGRDTGWPKRMPSSLITARKAPNAECSFAIEVKFGTFAFFSTHFHLSGVDLCFAAFAL